MTSQTTRSIRRPLAILFGLALPLVLVEVAFRVLGLQAPTYDAEAAEEEIDAPKNARGYHDFEWDLAKPEDTFRVLFLGDSFVAGMAVERDETFTRVVGESLNERCSGNVEAIHVSKPGWGTQAEVERLGQHLEEGLEVDLVVLVYFINDAAQGRGTNVLLKRSLRDSVYTREGFLNRVSAVYDYFDYRARRREVSQKTMDKYRESIRKQRAGGPWESSQAGLRELKRLSERYEFDVAMLMFPVLIQLHEEHELQDAYATVLRFAESCGIPSFPLLPIFLGYEPMDLWVHPTNSHPNAYGHRIAADGIEAILIDNAMIPCD